MTWIEGAPFGGFAGVFPLLAEEQQETCSEALALRWLRAMCEALDVLHRNGLVHGDISPRNMIVSGSDLVLTDYDFVGKIGELLSAPGTILYCSPSYQNGDRPPLRTTSMRWRPVFSTSCSRKSLSNTAALKPRSGG